MGFSLGRYPRNSIVFKILGCILSVVASIGSFYSSDLYRGLAFGVIALMSGYEVFATWVQHRVVRNLERVAFLVVFGVLILISAITK